MNRKLITVALLIMTLCLLMLGLIMKSTAKKFQGTSMSTGYIVDGEYKEVSSGKIGSDQDKYDKFNSFGTLFYITAGVTGTVCVVSLFVKK